MFNAALAAKKIIEDKSKKNIYNRYPIRFIFTPLSNSSENDILMLQTELNKKYYNSISSDINILNLYDLLSFEDAWITKTQLINYIKKLLSKKDDFIILGFSELVRFYSREDLEAIITSFMTDIESTNDANKRIYFICFSLFEQIALELKTNNRNETINPIIDLRTNSEEEDESLISVYYANSSFEGKLFKNKIKTSSEWLSIYKSNKLNLKEGIVCISDTLVSLYEKAKPDNFVAIEKLDSYYKLLTIMYKVKIKHTNETMFSDEFWKKIFELLIRNDSFELKTVLLNELNIKQINTEVFLNKLKYANEYVKNILLLYFYEFSNEFENYDYLLGVIDKSDKTYSNIIQIIYTNFINFDFYHYSCRKQILSLIDDRELLLYSLDYRNAINASFINFLNFNCFTSKIQIAGDDLFSCNFNEICKKYNMSINYLIPKFKSYFKDELCNIITCKNIDDKILVINLLRNKIILLEEINNLYSDLFKYLGYRKSPKLNNSLHWASNYLYEYKVSKMLDEPTQFFANFCNNITHENFLSWYNNKDLTYPFDLLKDKIYDVVIVFDGIGAEYFDYLNFIIEDEGYVITYANLAKCFLPSITSIHKEKYINKYNEWILDFDSNCIHNLFYRDLSLIPKELDEIKKIIHNILNKYKGRRIALIADHGCTISGRILKNVNTYSFDAEHEGRCLKIDGEVCLKENNDYFVYNNGDNKYLISLSGASLSTLPKRESHGGAMVEEVLVPCVIASSDVHAKNEIEYDVRIISNKLSGLNRTVSLEISPSIVGKTPILIEENGIEHELKLQSDNIWKTVDEINQIRTQKMSLIFDEYNKSILVESTMGISTEGDGFND